MAKYTAHPETMDPELAAVVTHLPDREIACDEIEIPASTTVKKGDILACTVVSGVGTWGVITSGYSSGKLAVAMEKVDAGATAVPVAAVARHAVIALDTSAGYYIRAKEEFEAQGCKVVAK